MKKIIITIFAIVSLIGCVQVEDVSVEDIISESAVNIEASELNDIAEMMTAMVIDQSLCNEVLQSVQRSMNVGLDENLYFRELWMDAEDVKVKSYSAGSILRERLEEQFSNTVFMKSSSIENLLRNSDLQIYWPYSENWDGETMPVIAPAPKVESDEFYGYRKVLAEDGSYIIETVLVNDDFAYDNPVWIINYMEFPYDDLMNLFIGQCETISETKSSSTSYLWEMDRMRVTKQYDKLSNGGSEFEVIVTYPQLDGYAPGHNRHMYEFTRAQIRNKTWVTIGNTARLLNTDWTEEQLSNHFALYGWDGGELDTTITSGTVEWVDPETGVKTTNTVSYTVYSKSTSYLEVNYTRNYMFSLGSEASHGISDGTVSWYTQLSEY